MWLLSKKSCYHQGCYLCFLFLIPFTIRQQCITYLQQTKRNAPLVCLQKFSTEPLRGEWWRKKGNAGRCLGLALGVGVLALEAAPTIQEVGFFSIENYTI